MTVIILEDDLAVCDAISLFVSQLGHAVRSFSDAESFFASIVPAPEDMVIVDIGLPGMDGSQVISWLNALASPPRVLAITGQSQTSIRDFLTESPSTMLMRKPLSPQELSSFFQ
ncbi:MAG: response regulator [Cohaesibacteraceae bacterium]